MSLNIHLFILTATIVFWYILRQLKGKQSITKRPRNSNFVYVLLMPVTLYSFYYFLTSNNSNLLKVQNKTELLSSPYPESITVST